jgi:hypothetical protein
MNLEILSFILGGLLVIVGVIGGGFEIKEFKIPPVRWPTRLFAIVVGLFFVSLGLGIYDSSTKENSKETSTEDSRSSSPIHFTIRDRLGDGQVSEQVTVLINGRVVGTLTVDQYHPTSTITVTVPREGQYSYTVEATAVFEVNGELLRYMGAGQGMIDVGYTKDFELAGSFSGNTWLVTLMEISQ